MKNYNRIILFYTDFATNITYKEYVMHMASPEKDWIAIIFYKDVIIHRLDGPALIRSNGDQEWYVNGKWHRLDGPARVWPGEQTGWCKNGKPHRSDGPAIERANGDKEWWFHGIKCENEQEFLELKTKDANKIKKYMKNLNYLY